MSRDTDFYGTKLITRGQILKVACCLAKNFLYKLTFLGNFSLLDPDLKVPTLKRIRVDPEPHY